MVDFKYTTKGLSVTFSNLSDDYPVDYRWLWEFGDGNTSDVENPTHEYTKSDFYRVTLKVLDVDGQVVDKVSKKLMVSAEVKTHLSDTIYALIDTYIPETIFGSVSYELKHQFINKWQLYIQPLVNHNVPIEEYSNETFYEALENQLIMELAAYDFMVVKANQMVSASAAKVLENNSVSSDSSSESSTGQPGSVKRIVTGPTEVEYFDIGSEDNDSISAITKALQPGGIIDILRAQLCMLAERLDIYLPICNQISPDVIVPKVVNRRKPRGLDGPNPPVIIKK